MSGHLGYKTINSVVTTIFSGTWSNDTYINVGDPSGYSIPAGTYIVTVGFVVNTTNNPRFDWGFSPGVTQLMTNIGNGVVTTNGKSQTSATGIISNSASTLYYIGAAAYVNTSVTINIAYVGITYTRIA